MPRRPAPAPGLRVRKLADTSQGERVRGFHPRTGAPALINPATNAPEPWPLAGVEAEIPPRCTVPSKVLPVWLAEGWVTAENERLVHRPGGPSEDPWRVTHTFVHVDTVTFHFVGGDVRCKVVHQPDKYADYGEASYPDQVKKFDGDDATPVTPAIYAAGATRVDWFYVLEREG